MPFQVLVVKPRGFCGGVEMAVATLEICLELFEPPIYMKHQIVHNTFVVDCFEKKGVIFVESVEEIPRKATAVFSAHGSPLEDYEIAKTRGIKVIDAVCPLVLKVDYEALKYAGQGYAVIVVGEKGHVEPQGVLSRIPENQRRFVSTTEEAKSVKVPDQTRVIRLTQTTLSVDDVKEITKILRDRFPQLLEPRDICYATDNRQTAVKAIARKVDVVLVVGSQESSNSNRLREVARNCGASAYLIDNANDINLDWFDGVSAVGITSGASVPEILVKEVISYLQEHGASEVKELEVVKEDIPLFKLPGSLEAQGKEKGKDFRKIRTVLSQKWE